MVTVNGQRVVNVPYTDDEPAPFCNSHRSYFCPCVAQFIEDRGDVDELIRVLTADEAVMRSDIKILVPVFPQFCVWEKLTYVLGFDERFGMYGELPDPLVKRHNLFGVRRITAGESAGDLANVVRQQFDDDLELEMGKLLGGPGMRPNLPWRCSGPRHSMKYQQVVDRIMSPNNVRMAWSSQLGNQGVIKAMVYCLMRHKRCLFCYVNENNRDAVRVNPDMQSVLGTQPVASDTDFDDLIPPEEKRGR